MRLRRRRPHLGGRGRGAGGGGLRDARRAGQQRLPVRRAQTRLRRRGRRRVAARPRRHADRRGALHPGRAAAPGGRARPARCGGQHRLGQRHLLLRQPLLQRGQGGPDVADPHAGGARGAQRGAGQPGRARHHPHPGLGGQGGGARRGGAALPARPDRRAGRHRGRRHLPRVVRRGLDHRGDAAGGRRHPAQQPRIRRRGRGGRRAVNPLYIAASGGTLPCPTAPTWTFPMLAVRTTNYYGS
ncbi:hypothetical protein SCOCK_90096 [Actinacidiphila cocklensis]|uniref:Uncharacterized protein n=1 Tax=Actinacidiphila cocklensis TaxID=887465 RepID=A0A9W4E0S2_9ACTN|nr:hypothetical protein SCOCK_90096 [Actinacidiphila cocklensis]